MGAPTGSAEVEMVTLPAETGVESARPVMVMVAGDLAASFLILSQVSGSGFQV